MTSVELSTLLVITCLAELLFKLQKKLHHALALRGKVTVFAEGK